MLPADFLTKPIAHRGLHDSAAGVVENSASAVRLAVEAGYGIEIDIQPSADGVAMVFHDDTLDRLTDETGRVAARSAADLSAIRLRGGGDRIPTLAQVCAIAQNAPLLIELKDQSGDMGPTATEPLARAVADALSGHAGPVAVMSFNPALVAAMAAHCPDLPRGITCDACTGPSWDRVPARRRHDLAEVADLDRVGASFISCGHRDLDRAIVHKIKAKGLPVLTWTIRNPAEEAAARQIADNITFEGYRPALT